MRAELLLLFAAVLMVAFGLGGWTENRIHQEPVPVKVAVWNPDTGEVRQVTCNRGYADRGDVIDCTYAHPELPQWGQW